jgi:hypothetical protein
MITWSSANNKVFNSVSFDILILVVYFSFQCLMISLIFFHSHVPTNKTMRTPIQQNACTSVLLTAMLHTQVWWIFKVSSNKIVVQSSFYTRDDASGNWKSVPSKDTEITFRLSPYFHPAFFLFPSVSFLLVMSHRFFYWNVISLSSFFPRKRFCKYSFLDVLVFKASHFPSHITVLRTTFNTDTQNAFEIFTLDVNIIEMMWIFLS